MFLPPTAPSGVFALDGPGLVELNRDEALEVGRLGLLNVDDSGVLRLDARPRADAVESARLDNGVLLPD